MSDYLDPNNEELLKDFFSEAQMQVETLEQNILALENDSNNRDAVDEIFRAAHTLKGGAATVEMGELAHFTHMIEDVLDAIRSDKLSVNETVVDTLLQSIDIVKAMLGERMQGAIYGEDIGAIESRLHALIEKGGGAKSGGSTKNAASQKTAAAPPAKKAAAAADLSSKTQPAVEEDLVELLDAAGGTPVYKIRVTFDENSIMNTVGGIQVYAALKSKGMVLKTVPDFDALYSDTFYLNVDYYIASNEAGEELRRYVILPDVSLDAVVEEIKERHIDYDEAADNASVSGTKTEVEDDKPAVEKAPEPALSTESEASSSGAKTAKPETQAPAANKNSQDAKKAAREAGSILRVDSKRIDDLLNLVSETVITKAAFNQISNQFGELANEWHSLSNRYRERIKTFFDSFPQYIEKVQEGTSVKDVRKHVLEEFNDLFSLFDGYETNLKNGVTKFRSTSQNLGRITAELQEGVMRIRMVPISQIFSRFPRLVRDLSKSLNKKINLVIEGEETELDKSVIEDLLDPIMHSVRNSVDHGIEPPEVRIAAGKPEEGTVFLKAANEGNMIVIQIGDDGKGIDVESIKAKAIERALIHPNKVLTDPEAYSLMFEPGFSTAKEITSISGRGVGLDVVKRQIEKLNGAVTVQSEKGKGTTFIIKLPLTLAIIQGLLVRVGSEIYSIPITSVIESLRIKPDEIKQIDSNEVFNIRNDVLSLLRLNQLFGIKNEQRDDYNFIVIVGTAEKKMGFMVDSLIGEEDVVIKPLRDQYTNSPGIAGASILGDGSVSLIIDVGQLLELGLSKEMENRKVREREAG
ncbi:MAG: chemotaxis protein CheA [Spirochaetaceae bacterium]|jgi:two-component system chemotaxis sensor kinase CheA|nr:chemotaxis protein CheA [Spirochaetaceae bacterium]